MKKKLHLFLPALILLLFFSTKNFGQAPNLGVTSSFALFSAAGAFSNDGASIVTGDIGTNVGAFTGFPPGIDIGQIHIADPASAQAASDVALAYSALSGTNCGMVLGTTLGNNQVLAPNVYCLGAASTLNGELILDGGGDPTAIFIFQIDGALSTSTLASVTLINGASLCNVFWQVNGAFDLGEGSVFKGTVIANGEITLLEGSSLIGRALTKAGAISLHNNVVNVAMQATASVISAATTTEFCAGGSVTLSGNVGGTWSTGATSATLTVTESGDYFVSNTSNCGTAVSNHILVTVNPLPVPTISANGPLTFCNGGSVVLTASSGSSYLWSTGATTPNITVTESGSYSVSVTNDAGCTATSAATTVTVNPNPTASISAGGPITFCAGGSVVLTASSGSSYLWSTGATTPNIAVTESGSYSVSVTNAAGCAGASASTVVTVNPNPTVSISANGPLSFCTGGSVILTASPGSSYAWSNGATTQNITVTTGGIYTVTVTNANGCAGTSAPVTVTISTGTTPVISANGPLTFCTGGSVILSATSSSGYLWSNGATTQSITVSASGNYSVTTTGACGGTSATTVVTVNPNPTATISVNGPVNFCQGGSVILTASSGSSYLWSTGATTASISVTATGSYSVTVTNANGCTQLSAATSVLVNPNPVATISANGATNFCQGGSVILTASSGNSYLWSTGATTASITVTASGNYSVTVTNANNCSALSAPVPVNVTTGAIPTISANGPTTFCQGGNVILTASSAASYSWSNGATTQSITVNSSGNYTVTTTGTCGGSSAATVITVNPNPTATISANGPVNFCQGGSVILTASSGSSYLWSNGATTASITVTASGNYSVTVTNANNCSALSEPVSVNVTTGAIPTISANGPTSFCQGGNVILTASAAASYSWSNGATSQSITVTSSGSYTVTTTGTCGGSSAATIVTVNPNPVATISANGPLSFCLGGNVILTASSGSSYVWSNGATTQSITVIAGGSYSVTVKNANGCSSASAAVIVIVTPNPVPTITANGPISFCQGGNVILTASSGTTYLWSNGATTQSITVTAGGSYSVSVTNACGTATSLIMVVTVNPLPNCAITGNGSICLGQSTQLCAPAGCKTYLWSTGATTSCITVSTAGTYSVRVTNNSGCSSTCYKTITVSPAPDCTITGNSAICAGQSTQLCAPAGCATYLWSTGATCRCITVTTAGTYSVTVTNSGGCSSTCTKIITVSPAPDCTITGSSAICLGQSTQLCAPAGCATYLWSTGATCRCITVTTAGTYSVTVTNSGGCSSTCTKTITVSPAPACTISGNAVICSGQSTQLCAPAGCATYLWSTGATCRCITVTTAGTYSVTVTNSGGCSSTCTKTITVSPAPACTISGNAVICSGQSTQLCAPAGCATYLWSTGATCRCITVTAAGTYTVTVTNSGGCSSTCTKTVTAASLPACSISGNSSFCQGQSTQLCAPAGCSTYLWSTGATTRCITITAGGTYSVTTTNAGGCASTCSKAVTMLPKPTCTISGTLVICAGHTIQLSATAGCTTYLWSTGATTSYIKVKTAGTYSVTVTNSNGCSNTSSVCVTTGTAKGAATTVPVSVKPPTDPLIVSAVNMDVRTFPNPFVNTVTIEILGHRDFAHVTVEIFNINGKKVAILFNGQVEANKPSQLKFNAEGLPGGIYLYRIRNGEEILNGKIVLLK
ncbi:MAG: ice-binding family protein [Ferruginibacter sp.]